MMAALCQSPASMRPDPPAFQLADGRGLCKAAQFIFPYIRDKSAWKWAKDVQHFDALPVRSPGLLFAGLACREQKYIDLWKTLNPDPADKEIIRNYPIRDPLLWVGRFIAPRLPGIDGNGRGRPVFPSITLTFKTTSTLRLEKSLPICSRTLHI